MSEWVVIVLRQMNNFHQNIIAGKSYIQWDDEDDVHFVLDQHT